MHDPASAERFTTLLAEHGPKLRKVTLTYGASAEDREDLHQEILVQLWHSFARYDESRPFATWMYRVALNVAISHLRRVTRDRTKLIVPADPVVDTHDPKSIVGARDDHALILRRLMADLDELDRALLLHLEERSYAEIADVLGVTESNVGTRLNRLRQRLRELATKEMSR